MTLTMKTEWLATAERLVDDGVFADAEEAAEAAFALLAEQADRLEWLRERIAAADASGLCTLEEVQAAIEEESARLAAEGIPE